MQIHLIYFHPYSFGHKSEHNFDRFFRFSLSGLALFVVVGAVDSDDADLVVVIDVSFVSAIGRLFFSSSAAATVITVLSFFLLLSLGIV